MTSIDLEYGVQIIGKHIKTYDNTYIPIKNIQNYQINDNTKRIHISTLYINRPISNPIEDQEIAQNFMKNYYTI